MKKLFLLFVALLATTTLWAHNFEVDGIYYNYLEDNNVEVTYRGNDYDSYDNEYSGAVSIPSTATYNGTTYSVTSIGEGAFCQCSSLTSITISESVTRIGSYAFLGCSSLTTITIPNSVTSIGDQAFLGCSSLTTITIPNSVTSIGDFAFSNCSSLTSIVVKTANTTYDSRDNCNAIIETATNTLVIGCKNTIIPNSVTSIGGNAFFRCSSLTSITIPNSVTSIGDYAFQCCSSLASITIPNSVTSIGDGAFWECSSLTSITIPNSVKSIGNDAFFDCSSLTSVTIGNSVTSIGDHAFFDCSSLTSITIPESVTSIGYFAFHSCSALTSITIPNSVTTVGGGMFYRCSKLKSVVLSNNITSLPSYRDPYYYDYGFFEGCSSLTTVTIPNSVTSIGDKAFWYCSSLTSIAIPNSVTSIGERAFFDCSSLTSITLPNSVTSIGNSAFADCSGLTSITCEAETPPTVGQYTFNGVSELIPVYVPCGYIEAYQTVWYKFFNIRGIPLYSIEISTSNSQMGFARVSYQSCDDVEISAEPNYGYHFVRWSDGNTDNPRTLTLTQDTTFTAEFAINQYTISTASSHDERGTTKGDTIADYLEYITITATPNSGYHFVQWNDDNTDNPRQVQVTGDATYTATFDKNTYAISLSCNEGGRVEGVTSAEYLDTVTISATPNIGYHFVQWSDGSTDTIRTLVLTQDTTFAAEFAQSFSGQCGDNLYWSYNETAKTVSITGSGKMYDYTVTTQPWLLFKEQIVEVTTNNTATSIGTSAFEGCVRLAKISLGTGLEEIATNAFAGCTRLYDIYVYATYPPFADESSFANYNVYVYIPCKYQRDYILDVVWGNFKFIECLSAESEPVAPDTIIVTPGTTDVTITWPTEEGADTYTIVIKKDGEVVCTLTFNSEGQLLNIAFAPGRKGTHSAQYAAETANGLRFTVTGLEEGTNYTYDVITKDKEDNQLSAYSGEFTTYSNTPSDLENLDTQSPKTDCQKLLRDGQLLILKDNKVYTLMGQEIQ